VSIPATSNAISGDVMPVYAVIDINDNRIWVGYSDFTVAAADEATNLNVSLICCLHGETMVVMIRVP